MKQTMVILAWISFLTMLSIGFSRYLDKQTFPNQSISDNYSAEQGASIRLLQNRQGHYIVGGEINRTPATFILDTGATSISIPGQLAQKIGLSKGFPVRTKTANGDVTVYRLSLDSVRIGPIMLRGVQAHINPHMKGDEVLLGMSFLKHLDMVQKGKEITLSLPNRL